VGHSFGALLGALLVPLIGARAYVSLSGVWNAWPSVPPLPLSSLNAPSLFSWGSTGHPNEIDAVLEGSPRWNQVPLPKHKLVFADGDHWDYLPSSQIACGQMPGSCTLIKSLAADFVTVFLSKYMWPEESGILPGLIDDNLIPPVIQLSPEQQFYAGGHLMGLAQIVMQGGCSVTQSWEVPGGHNGSITLP
jgi:hypothetical protein